MRLTLGPLQYFWPRERVHAFYRAAAGWPVDVIYLGETVCSKRRELTTRDWIALAGELAASGREIVLSSLALLEAESELASLTRLVENGRFRVEANDMSAVQMLRSRGLPFVGGPGLNVYNHAALRLLREDGMQRLVLGVEQGREFVAEFRASGEPLPELEIPVWGRLPLAYSARCFTARHHGLQKDACEYRCLGLSDGIDLRTREGAPFLTINGTQTQSAGVYTLLAELDALASAGVGVVRVSPQGEGTFAVLAAFRDAIDGRRAPTEAFAGVRRHFPGEPCNGFWHGRPGVEHIA